MRYDGKAWDLSIKDIADLAAYIQDRSTELAVNRRNLTQNQIEG